MSSRTLKSPDKEDYNSERVYYGFLDLLWNDLTKWSEIREQTDMAVSRPSPHNQYKSARDIKHKFKKKCTIFWG